jgi:phage-related protein
MAHWNVIFYRTHADNRPARELILNQNPEKRQKIESYLIELRTKGNMVDRSISKKISKNIFELKVSDIRLFYYFGNFNYIVIVHAVIKKRQELDSKDIELAEKNRKDYINRFQI